MTKDGETPRKLISICVPVYNEEDNIQSFYDRILTVLDDLGDRYDFEILFTDNHSEDATFDRLVDLSNRDHRVRVIRFSRNFGFQRSILANYINCRGDAAIQIDVDLQDPPEILPEFLRLWEEGYQVVYGVRRSRPEESPLLHGLRKLFYRLVDFLSEDKLPHDAGDFRLVDRCVLNHLCNITDQQPYLRGLISAMGFRQLGVVYDRSARERGKSKFNIARLVGLALDGILHHSIVPLRIATICGLVLSVFAALGGAYYFLARLLFPNEWPPGIASTNILIIFSIGMNAIFMGIIGEYIGRIYKNVKQMPLTIIEAVIDHQADTNDTYRATPRAPTRPTSAAVPTNRKTMGQSS
ncbi:MAG: glycosyltransferase family 2 protein [Rhizobiaceae bacterium]